MKQSLLLLSLVFTVAFGSVYGQEVELCSQHKKFKELMADPVFAAQYAADQAKLKQKELELAAHPVRGTVYTIPVVFHVLHNGGKENISREQIVDCIRIMNRDYRRMNADADQVHPDFIGMPADIEIEFVLATKAPDGTCFSGITRTISPLTSAGHDGSGQVDAIVAGNDVYRGNWPGNKYLNIYVCEDIGGAAGYAYYPTSALPVETMKRGIWVLYNYVGSIGQSTPYTSRTLTHETGHWFNLEHTWGNNNDAQVACGSDEVDDTPETRGTKVCNLNENFCGPRANVENYMDYSYCSKMFTPGQRDRMRAAVVSDVGGRQDLWTVENLDATGVSDVAYLCKVNFSSSETAICVGQTVKYHDESYNKVTSWNWNFVGGTPAVSHDQNPVITYNTPGVYNAKLTAVQGTTVLHELKNNYVTVFGPGEGLPFFEGFEGLDNFTGSNRWMVKNFSDNNGWEVTNTAAHSGTRSAKLGNFGETEGSLDELISSPINLSTLNPATDKLTFSYRYAYHKKDSSNNDYLGLFVTTDCGTTWNEKKSFHGTSLSTDVDTNSWTPTPADWVTVHVTNINSGFWTDQFRFKFQFIADNGNNVYLDDINIYTGDPSDQVVVGLTENTASVKAATLFPNPADDEVNVRFTSLSGQKVDVSITDLAGNVLQRHIIQANEGENLVLMSTTDLAPGMYLVRLNQQAGNQTLQFVVK